MKSEVRNELKRRELRSEFSNGSNSDCLEHKEGKYISLECLIGFIFDHLTQNLQKFDQLVLENHENQCSCFTNTASSLSI